MSMILASLAFLSTKLMSGLLASTIISCCTLKFYRTLKSPFSTTRSGICLYHWSCRSSLAFPYIYQGLFQQPQPCSLAIHFRHVPDILPIHFFLTSVFHFSLLILVTLPGILCLIHRHCSSLTCKDLTFAHPLFTASCSRMNSPVNQTNRFLMVSFLILLRSLRVNILKQLFTSGSVNIVE